MNTAVKANCQLYPIALHTVNTKKALRPIPGASPNGNLPMNAIAIQPMIDARAVAVKTAPPGIGLSLSALKMSGFTARIYDIVRNVVIPARISVLTVVFVESKPKSFLSILLSVFSSYSVIRKSILHR